MVPTPNLSPIFIDFPEDQVYLFNQTEITIVNIEFEDPEDHQITPTFDLGKATIFTSATVKDNKFVLELSPSGKAPAETYSIDFELTDELGAITSKEWKITILNNVFGEEEVEASLPGYAHLNITDVSAGGLITILSNETIRVPNIIDCRKPDDLDVKFVLNSDLKDQAIEFEL